MGISPETTRPVDMFAVNSLELPPFAGCGCGAGVPYGCGRMLVDGQQVAAAATRWSVNEASRRSAPLTGSGVVVETGALPLARASGAEQFQKPLAELARSGCDGALQQPGCRSSRTA